jgi:hypothetical protein
MKVTKIILLLTFLNIISCRFVGKNTNDNFKDSITDNNSITDFEIGVYTKYEIPLNIDILNFLFDSNINFDKDLINPAGHKENYLTEISRAINLGIYTSDLAYSTVFSESQLSLDYFNINRELANDLGFIKGFDETYFKRLEENASNRDSLKIIAEESYWVACDYLEEEDKNNILPFVVFGGWIETMQILVNLENDFYKNDILKKQILNQNYAVTNIIKYLYDVMIESSAFYFSEDLKNIITQLKIIEKLYKDYQNNKSEKVYEKIKSKIIEIRNTQTEML